MRVVQVAHGDAVSTQISSTSPAAARPILTLVRQFIETLVLLFLVVGVGRDLLTGAAEAAQLILHINLWQVMRPIIPLISHQPRLRHSSPVRLYGVAHQAAAWIVVAADEGLGAWRMLR